ncbi:hypothetical protein Asp14428_06510 [Actinoplanes sp. NBRC 14428]|nr:hypothetical protein Asp14428_06510 [Actinoplanes sp. NBRC 14428]
MDPQDRIAALVAQAGYGTGDAVVAGVRRGSDPPVFVAQGIAAGTVLYTASLSKQVTAACAALLVTQGRLDVESALGGWMPELPAWADGIRVRHLIHHTSGLPEGVEFDDLHAAGRDRTTAGIIRALGRTDRLLATPGTTFRYCNSGYVCLAVVVERAAGRPLPDFAREQVFEPLRMTATRFWPGPQPRPPGAAPTGAGYPAPLSLGDGGMWSTAPDLLRWNDAMSRDELGVAALVQSPGELGDYAWGIDVRTYAGTRVYRHGGLWAGLSAQLVRIPGAGGFVVLALDIDEDRTAGLAGALIADLLPGA